MALPKQLKSARMSGSTLGKDIPANIGALEAAICDILGFTIDSDVTESPEGADNAGRFTKALLRQKAAAPVGWRFLDSTGGKEFRLINDGTYVSIDENTGTESAPVWTNRWKMAISTGIVTFSAIPVGPASDPTTDNQFARKKFVDDALTALGITKVGLTGAEIVAGVKTFSSFPITPSSAPITDYQIANKKYVDNEVATVSQKIVQIVSYQTGAFATTSTAIPMDDTIPQKTEGGEFMTLAITPTSLTNKLRIDVVWNGGYGGGKVAAALFQGEIANALAVVAVDWAGVHSNQIKFTHIMDAPAIVATTFKVRAGASAAAAIYFNGTGAGAQIFGGVMASSIVITEYVP